MDYSARQPVTIVTPTMAMNLDTDTCPPGKPAEHAVNSCRCGCIVRTSVGRSEKASHHQFFVFLIPVGAVEVPSEREEDLAARIGIERAGTTRETRREEDLLVRRHPKGEGKRKKKKKKKTKKKPRGPLPHTPVLLRARLSYATCRSHVPSLALHPGPVLGRPRHPDPVLIRSHPPSHALVPALLLLLEASSS